MNDQFGRENDLAEKMRSTFALMQMSETELIQLLHRIVILQEELQGIPLLDDELLEAVTVTQKLLNRWNDEVTRIFAVKEMKGTTLQPGNRDNEGGRVQPAS